METDEAIDEREEAWFLYPKDAADILTPSEAKTTFCGQRKCRAMIWWGLTRANGKRCPFDVKDNGERTGTSHWRTCRDRPGRT